MASLHGDLPQVARDAAIASLRSGRCDVLVATDVAARGLDLPGVELVIHADLPRSADSYAHRAGRAGRPGCAVRGVSLLLPGPDPKSTAAVAALERDARVAVRRLTAVGERRVPGRSLEAAAAAAAAAAARSASFDAVTVGSSASGAEPVVAATTSGSACMKHLAPVPASAPSVSFAAAANDSVGEAGGSREEEAESARARQGERLLVMDRFDMLAGELGELHINGKGPGTSKKGKGKGRR